jgi:HD-GYP domain-containing protein (c-di-GMP phosphodiesterase class II)
MVKIPFDDESIGRRIVILHNDLMGMWPDLTRMAIAIYNPDSDELNTFVYSDHSDLKLKTYCAKLSEVPSLKSLADNHQQRVVDDLGEFADSDSVHSQWLIEAGFKSSFTTPLYGRDHLLGFLFFDSFKEQYFVGQRLKSFKVYSELLEAILLNELSSIYTLRGAINTTQFLTNQRHSETAGHIMRMAHYAHLIAKCLSMTLGLKDDYIEFILQYAPLHDVGKIGIMDDLLLKPGKLNQQEFEDIKCHVTNGIKIINTIVREFDLGHFAHLDILYNIIGAHHEKMDGSGYPKGLKGDEIPLEGRIIAVADVLDALSNPRVYKNAWGFEESIRYLKKHSGTHFDPLCVNAVIENVGEFEKIFQKFSKH